MIELLLVGALLSEQAAPAAPDPPAESCAVGGWTVGAAAPNVKDQAPFIARTPKIYKPKGVRFYEDVRERRPLRRQFIGVVADRVVSIVRQFEGEESARVYAALTERYGDPTAVPMAPEVKASYSPFGGSLKFINRAFWTDEECGVEIQIITQSKTSFTALGGGTGDLCEVIWTAVQPSPLD